MDQAPLTIGIDVGSRTTKAVLLRGEAIAARVVQPTAWDAVAGSREVLTELYRVADMHTTNHCTIFSTGYGRDSVPHRRRSVTEITCHARGALQLCPQVRTVIDIGGQDAKVISLDATGFAQDFVMNDRCAAGTGRFLEFMALSIGLPLEEFARLGQDVDNAAEISSMCTVFAESEMVSLRSRGTPREQVIAGLHKAIARRIAGMVGQVGCRPPVMFTGGVALNLSMKMALQDILGMELLIPREPVLVGALGAALLAKEASFYGNNF